MRITHITTLDSQVVIYEHKMFMGLTTGLVVMGGVSCLRGCGFESEHRILEGPDFTLVCFENCLKRPKQNEKEAVLR